MTVGPRFYNQANRMVLKTVLWRSDRFIQTCHPGLDPPLSIVRVTVFTSPWLLNCKALYVTELCICAVLSQPCQTQQSGLGLVGSHQKGTTLTLIVMV